LSPEQGENLGFCDVSASPEFDASAAESPRVVASRPSGREEGIKQAFVPRAVRALRRSRIAIKRLAIFKVRYSRFRNAENHARRRSAAAE